MRGWVDCAHKKRSNLLGNWIIQDADCCFYKSGTKAKSLARHPRILWQNPSMVLASICRNRILNHETETNNWVLPWINFGETKELEPNQTVLEIRKLNWLFPCLENVGLYLGAKPQKTIVQGTASTWTCDFLLLEATICSLWTPDSWYCWELRCKNKSNFLNSLKKKELNFYTCDIHWICRDSNPNQWFLKTPLFLSLASGKKD